MYLRRFCKGVGAGTIRICSKLKRCHYASTKDDRAGAPKEVKKVVTIGPLSDADASIISDELLAFGVNTSIEKHENSAKEDEIFQGDNKVWEICRVVAFFDGSEEIQPILNEATSNVDCRLSDSQIHVCDLDESKYSDWMEIAKSAFKTVQVSEDICIIPMQSGELPKDLGNQEANLNIYIEPGFAFGTGEHQTTKLCLRWLKQHKTRGKIIVDYGTGSGILAIAAMKLKAKKVLAVDVESDAIFATNNNTILNGIDPQMIDCKLVEHDGVLKGEGGKPSFEADCLIANILLEPLLELKDVFSEILSTDGSLVLSGILANQVDQVKERYAEDFCNFEEFYEDEWALISAIKR